MPLPGWWGKAERGIENELVNVGVNFGLPGGGPPVGWLSGKKRVWSALDIGNPYEKKQKTMPITRKRARPLLRRRLMYRKRRMVFRRRRYARSRRNWGTRVRRAALRNNESKRFATRNTGALRDVQITDPLLVLPLARVPVLTPTAGVGVNLKNQRAGVSIMGTGIAIRLQFENLRSAEDMVVRIIVGYKKYNRGSTTNDDIFMNVETEANTALNGIPSYFQRMIARLDSKRFRKLHDSRIQLTANAEDAMGTDSRLIKMWIPFKKPITFETDQVGNNEQTYDPILYLMCYNKAGTAIPTDPENCVRFSNENIFYFRDP